MRWSVEKFRPYLYGTKFTIYTDHKSLEYIMSTKDSTWQLFRWSMFWQDYDFDIVYRPGKFNQSPDSLSQSPFSRMLSSITWSASAGPRFGGGEDVEEGSCEGTSVIEALQAAERASQEVGEGRDARTCAAVDVCEGETGEGASLREEETELSDVGKLFDDPTYTPPRDKAARELWEKF